MEAKDNRKRSSAQINMVAIQKVVANGSDSNAIPRVPRKKKARDGMLPSNKQNKSNTLKNVVIQSYCVICNKDGIPECNYIPHSAETCFFNMSDH